MAYACSGAWLFCSLLLLYFGQTMGLLPDPTISASPSVLHEGLTYNFTCNRPSTFTNQSTYYWVIDGMTVHLGPDDYFELKLNSSHVGRTLVCFYEIESTSDPSPESNDFSFTFEALPAPTISPVDPSESLIDFQPYELNCSAPSYLHPYIDQYILVREAAGRSTTNKSNPEPIKTVLVSQLTRVNFTCAYEIGDLISPFSDTISLLATGITDVVVTPSSFRVPNGSVVNFTCHTTTHRYVTPVPGGDIYTFRWFDGMDNLEANSNVSVLTKTLMSNITYRCEAAANNDIFTSSVYSSVTLLEIPKPSISTADVYYFSNNTYTFHCLAPPIDNVNYTAYSWKVNGTLAMNEESNQMTFDMPKLPYTLSITCHSLIDSYKSEESDPIDVTVSVIPQPTIQVSPDHGIFINGMSYNFTCVSTFSSLATDYRFDFPNDVTLNSIQDEPIITLIADVSRAHEFTCIVTNSNHSSDRSNPFSMTATVPSPPTIEILDAPSHYLVGTQYVLECQSNLEAFVTRYCLKNFTNVVTCRSSKRFNFTAEETEQLLTCNIFFGKVSTSYSQGASVIGSGIVSIIASASTLTPFPGTNVTLTCSPTLTSGYTQSNVIFSWKEDATLVAQTMVASVYVTNDMEMSLYCEGTTGAVDVSSNVLNMTARDLPTPTIEVRNRPANDIYEPGYYYSLICNSELEDLLTTYNWYSDGQLIDNVHTKQYLAQAMSYKHNYTCTFVVVSEESPGSPSLTIATDSIVSVHVESNGPRETTLTPVFDSTLTLTCEATIKSTATESPIYNWLESGIQKVRGQELTIVAYAGYNHTVICEVTVGDDDKASDQVMITSREDLPIPEISLTTHQVSQILPRASYTLECISASLSLNSSVTWYKDLSPLSCLQDLTLHITRYDPSIHDGQYTCEISVFGMAARTEPTVMLGIVPGKQCQESNVCTAQGEGYTGACEDQRCVCSEGYTTKLNACVLD